MKISGGDDGIRTHDPLLAGQVLSQLSYTPVAIPSFFRVLFTDPENRTTKHFTYSALLVLVFSFSVLCEMDCFVSLSNVTRDSSL